MTSPIMMACRHDNRHHPQHIDVIIHLLYMTLPLIFPPRCDRSTGHTGAHHQNPGGLPGPKEGRHQRAQHDEIIPIRHAEALFKALRGNKKIWTIKGAGHNDWPTLVDVPKWQEFMDFVGGEPHKKSKPTPSGRQT